MQDVDSIQLMHRPKITNVATNHAIRVGPKLDTEVTSEKDDSGVDRERGGDSDARDLEKKQVSKTMHEEIITISLMYR